MLSKYVEDYIKNIYMLQESGRRVSTTALAQSLKVSAASATNMIKKLTELSLVEYRPYRGARLTELGEKVALEIIRHHRLLELYLTEVVGMSWDKVHAEADALEHVISEELEELMDRKLGRPASDPHGDPIPSKDLEVPPPRAGLACLRQAQAGEAVEVVRILDANPEVLRYLANLGLKPGALLRILEVAPFGGPLRVRVVGGKEQAIGGQIADQILVVPRVPTSARARRKASSPLKSQGRPYGTPR